MARDRSRYACREADKKRLWYRIDPKGTSVSIDGKYRSCVRGGRSAVLNYSSGSRKPMRRSMAEQEGADLKGRRLLIAEDEYIIAVDMAEFFEEAGAEVIGPVGSVKDALALVAREHGRLDGAL